MVRLTLMPISWAAPLSSETARMALPILVRPVKAVRASIMTTQAAMVTRVTWEMVSGPIFWLPLPTMGEKILGLEDHRIRAEF